MQSLFIFFFIFFLFFFVRVCVSFFAMVWYLFDSIQFIWFKLSFSGFTTALQAWLCWFNLETGSRSSINGRAGTCHHVCIFLCRTGDRSGLLFSGFPIFTYCCWCGIPPSLPCLSFEVKNISILHWIWKTEGNFNLSFCPYWQYISFASPCIAWKFRRILYLVCLIISLWRTVPLRSGRIAVSFLNPPRSLYYVSSSLLNERGLMPCIHDW